MTGFAHLIIYTSACVILHVLVKNKDRYDFIILCGKSEIYTMLDIILLRPKRIFRISLCIVEILQQPFVIFYFSNSDYSIIYPTYIFLSV